MEQGTVFFAMPPGIKGTVFFVMPDSLGGAEPPRLDHEALISRQVGPRTSDEPLPSRPIATDSKGSERGGLSALKG